MVLALLVLTYLQGLTPTTAGNNDRLPAVRSLAADLPSGGLFIGALIRHGDEAIAQAEPEPTELYVPREWVA